jgi:3-hydroxyacyl-[acyl-carrier-protein] dehydratase
MLGGLAPHRRFRVAGKDLILDFSEYDVNHVIADQAEIRRYNLQRFEMEQLTAVIYADKERGICAGYKDITDDEFWVRGHMPTIPLMPGVVMCEAVAQLSSYFAQKFDLLGCKVVGLGGLEEVRFRGAVVPGDRLVMVVQRLRVRRNSMILCHFQGFVREALVVEGKIMGISLPIDPPRQN